MIIKKVLSGSKHTNVCLHPLLRGDQFSFVKVYLFIYLFIYYYFNFLNFETQVSNIQKKSSIFA